MRVVLDSCVLIDYLGGKPNAGLRDAVAESRAYVTPVVAAEVLSGRLTSAQRQDVETLLSTLPWCDTPPEHWFRVGRLRDDCARKGLSVALADAHVAQCALDLDGSLMTTDGVFARLARHAKLRLEKI
jgi:tRNA(fMet)-specific endonuclease VapC